MLLAAIPVALKLDCPSALVVPARKINAALQNHDLGMARSSQLIRANSSQQTQLTPNKDYEEIRAGLRSHLQL
jgi:hypothetical protein